MKIRLTRQTASASIVYGLTVYAFLNSYMHGVRWAQAHSSHEDGAQGWAWGNAAIPELILISVILRGKRDLRAYVGGSASVGWTLWVNGAGAAPGLSGMVVSLLAPAAALLCLWLKVPPAQEAQPEPDQHEEPEAQPVELSPAQKAARTRAQKKAQREAQEAELRAAQLRTAQAYIGSGSAQDEAQTAAQAVAAQLKVAQDQLKAQEAEPVEPRPVAQIGTAQKRSRVVDEGATWLRKQTKEQSLQDIMMAQNCSYASAKRIRREVFGPVNKSGKSDEEKTA